MMLAPSPPKNPKQGYPTAQDARGQGGGGRGEANHGRVKYSSRLIEQLIK